MSGTICKDLLLELFKYNSRAGKLYWKRSQGNVKAGDEAGTVDSNGYRCIRINGKQYKAHRLIWVIETGEFPTKQVDHINGERDDNRFENLRDVTNRVNGMNQRMPASNTSGVMGVCWEKASSKWRARIMIEGKYKHLGLFEDLDEAAKVRKSAEVKFGFHENHGKVL